MESIASPRQLAADSKAIARRLLIVGENRLELLMVEMQEERERWVRAVLLACSVAAIGLLAGITLTAAIVIWLRASPAATLLVLSILYGAAAVYLWRRLARLLCDWQTFSASIDQLRKDSACLEKTLS
jgi:uncharacterized membrane protein YqjE